MCNTLTAAPQWTETDMALAREAAALIRSDAWRQDPTLGVGDPTSYDSATTDEGLILRMRVGKDFRLRSNTTAQWFAKNKRRKRGDHVVRLGVPLPLATHDRTGPGTYADKYHAEMDKIRFAFWARLGQPDLAALMDLLKAKFRVEHETYINAIKARRSLTAQRQRKKCLCTKGRCGCIHRVRSAVLEDPAGPTRSDVPQV